MPSKDPKSLGIFSGSVSTFTLGGIESDFYFYFLGLTKHQKTLFVHFIKPGNTVGLLVEYKCSSLISVGDRSLLGDGFVHILSKKKFFFGLISSSQDVCQELRHKYPGQGEKFRCTALPNCF